MHIYTACHTWCGTLSLSLSIYMHHSSFNVVMYILCIYVYAHMYCLSQLMWVDKTQITIRAFLSHTHTLSLYIYMHYTSLYVVRYISLYAHMYCLSHLMWVDKTQNSIRAPLCLSVSLSLSIYTCIIQVYILLCMLYVYKYMHTCTVCHSWCRSIKREIPYVLCVCVCLSLSLSLYIYIHASYKFICSYVYSMYLRTCTHVTPDVGQ